MKFTQAKTWSIFLEDMGFTSNIFLALIFGIRIDLSKILELGREEYLVSQLPNIKMSVCNFKAANYVYPIIQGKQIASCCLSVLMYMKHEKKGLNLSCL